MSAPHTSSPLSGERSGNSAAKPSGAAGTGAVRDGGLRRGPAALAPQTVVSPPTPIDGPKGGILGVDFPKPPPASTVSEEPVQYESPDEGDEHAVPALTSTSTAQSTNAPSLPPPSRGHSTISSSSFASSGLDDVSVTHSSPSISTTSLSGPLPLSSPHLFPIGGSSLRPSSPDFRPNTRGGRRQSSQHKVRETVSGEQRTGLDGQRMINQYRIGKKLGHGAYASVMLGLDVGTGTEYVGGAS